MLKMESPGDEDITTRTVKKFRHDDLPTFYPTPIKNFDRKFPYFGKPTEVGVFSKASADEVLFDRSSLRYLYDKRVDCRVDLNLREGYHTYISNEDNLGGIESLLKWFESYYLSDVVHGDRPDIFCWRGLITKLLVTPYENKEDWSFVAEKFGGVVFMSELDTLQKIESKKNETERSKEMTYWGYKFEQYMTTGVANGIPATNIPVDSNVSFVSVVKTRLEDHSLVFGGEVDCCSRKNVQDYTELKTNRIIETQRQRDNFIKFKLLKWWAQSFLIGIPRIVCGFRDDEGVVRHTETFGTLGIPKLCEGTRNEWRANVCFNFVNDFFKHVREVVKEDGRVYKFDSSANRGVSCQVVTGKEVIPQSFKDKFSNIS